MSNIWLCSYGKGLIKMMYSDSGEFSFKYFNTSDGFITLENSIPCINGLGSQIWVGTKKGLCNIIAGSNNITWYTINQGGLPHNLINGLYIDKSGRIWVTTRSNTLAYIKDGKVNKIVLNSPNGSSTLGPITEDSSSRIWVGSNGNGVYMIQSDSVVNLTSKEGLVSNYCYSLISDNNKNLWVGHKAGLSRIRTTDFSIKPIYRFDGLTDNYQFNPRKSNSLTETKQNRWIKLRWNGPGIMCIGHTTEKNSVHRSYE